MELVVFDFDHTIISKNADTYINRLAPNRKIPESIKSLYKNTDWTPYMREVFKYLHKNGVTQEDYFGCLEEIELIPGFQIMLQKLNDNEMYDVIIISDANTIFIDHILKNAGVREAIGEVFSNPAWFGSDGCLNLKEYHIQDYCSLSSRNLCKGQILETFLKKQKQKGIDYCRVSYVGDGSNDFCPSLRLTKDDIVFPRKGFSLLNKLEGQMGGLPAKICPWENGWEIISILNI